MADSGQREVFKAQPGEEACREHALLLADVEYHLLPRSICVGCLRVDLADAQRERDSAVEAERSMSERLYRVVEGAKALIAERDEARRDRDALAAQLATESVARMAAEAERNACRRELPEFDCCRTGGPYSDSGGIHCPPGEPCQRCQADALTVQRDALKAEVERLKTELEEAQDALLKSVGIDPAASLARLNVKIDALPPAPAVPTTGRCDERCVGYCDAGTSASPHPRKLPPDPQWCPNWRCDGSGPAHRPDPLQPREEGP